jgi:crotonobetainyl-CoA:carnitine CoA-transferase CaiB-like acyl-CoA transferase
MQDLGAEGRKSSCGDQRRNLGTATKCGNTRTWLSETRNEKPVTVDPCTPYGSENFKWLVSDSDVLGENVRSGALEKWRAATRHRA